MSTKDDTPSEAPEPQHLVGYGSPPKATRFRKGVSGNPKGRPKGSLNVATLLFKILHEKVVIIEHGKRKKVTKFEATLKQLVNKAASGDLRAQRQLLELAKDAEAKWSEMEVAVEKSKSALPDFKNMSEDEAIESLVGSSVDVIEECLDCLNNEHIARSVQLREAAPRLRELQQGLTSLVESLAEDGVPSVLENSELADNENEGSAPTKGLRCRTERIGFGGWKHVYG